jgi:hypothetical protein
MPVLVWAVPIVQNRSTLRLSRSPLGLRLVINYPLCASLQLSTLVPQAGKRLSCPQGNQHRIQHHCARHSVLLCNVSKAQLSRKLCNLIKRSPDRISNSAQHAQHLDLRAPRNGVH